MSPLKNVITPDEVVVSKIYVIRDQKVMLDEDLAELYGVEIRRLNEHELMNHDQKIELLFTYLSKFIEKEEQPGTEIGFKRNGK